MRRKLRVPQIAAVMGPCIAGGAYLPALSDVIIMVENTSFMGLGGPNLVKGATGQVTDQESLGGARMHTTQSGVAHYTAKNDEDALDQIRARFEQFPLPPNTRTCRPPAKSPDDLYGVLPPDHRLAYDIHEILDRIFDAQQDGRPTVNEFQPGYAPEMLCGEAMLEGRPVAIIANRRGFLRTSDGPRVGGIVYTETARKVHYFVENAERAGTPLIYIQDVSGFMVGLDAELRRHHTSRG